MSKVDEEKDYLEYFYQAADFGPAHEDVVRMINEEYEADTGKKVPRGYSDE